METQQMTAQSELEGMPELDSAGKAAVKIINANEKISMGKQERELAQEELVEILKSTDRNRIKVDGKLFVMDHKDAKDIIKVVSDKTKSEE